MRDQDEGPYVVIERHSGGGAGAFILGALVGAGVALLLAPRSGEETQQDLKDRALKLKSAAEARMREAQKQLEERLDTAREGVHAKVDGMKEAVEAGRRAAVEARDDLERKLERSKAAYRAGVDAARQAVTASSEAENGEEED